MKSKDSRRRAGVRNARTDGEADKGEGVRWLSRKFSNLTQLVGGGGEDAVRMVIEIGTSRVRIETG